MLAKPAASSVFHGSRPKRPANIKANMTQNRILLGSFEAAGLANLAGVFLSEYIIKKANPKLSDVFA